MNRGFICVKGKAEIERLYHPDRLKQPMRRTGGRGAGKWETIDWERALDEIAEKLTSIKERYTPKSIAAIHGTGPRASLCSTLLPYALGSPNRISVDLHICYAPSLLAEGVTIGQSVLMEEGPDYLNANCIIVWGGNPLVSHPPRGREILEAKRRRGAKLIVIDPRQTELASQADLWLPVRPGTDVALALGMMNVIIFEELYDKAFVAKWCYGFDKLKDHVAAYAPEKVAEISWVPESQIKEAARMYATTRPATLHHRVAVEHNVNATQTDRSLIILTALTGNIDVKGGNLLPPHIEGYIPSPALSGGGKWLPPGPEVEKERLGSREYPLASGPEARLPFVPSFIAVDAMLTGKPYPLKALYCAGANPIVNVQNSKKVWKALQNLELLTVVDFFMTPTAELADYVLPATTWLERDECCDIPYSNYAAARQKVIEPLYECWDDLKIIIELVKRIGWANREIVPWDRVSDCYDWMLKGVGMTFETFKKEGYFEVSPEYKKYERHGFETPSGKVELYSTTFEKYGYNPLPVFREPPLGPVTTPELMTEYPHVLVTGSRQLAYFHSEGRQIPKLRKMAPDPIIEIHREAAEGLGIRDGDLVWVETPQVEGERVRFKTSITSKIHPKIVHAQHGWWFPEKPGPEHGCFESNINVVLSGDPPRDEIFGSVPTRGTICKIYK